MKILLTILIFVPSLCFGWGVVSEQGGGVSTCDTAISPNFTGSFSSAVDIGEDTGRYYVGATVTLASSHDVCGVEFYLTHGLGDVSSKDFTVYIYDQADPVVTLLGTSSVVAATSAWNTYSAEPVKFSFSSPVSLSAGDYSVLITMGEIDASNYMVVDIAESDTVSGLGWARYDSTGDLLFGNANDVGFVLYE